MNRVDELSVKSDTSLIVSFKTEIEGQTKKNQKKPKKMESRVESPTSDFFWVPRHFFMRMNGQLKKEKGISRTWCK